MTTSRPARVEAVQRIAVLRANALGDFLVVVPALQALRDAYPGAQITVMGSPWLPELLQSRPGPWDRAVVAPNYPGIRGQPPRARIGSEVKGFVQEHRALDYDLAVQMQGGGRNSNSFIRELRARLAVGPRTPDAEPLDRMTPYLPHRHEVLRWLEVVALVGAYGPGSVDALTPRLAVTAADIAESRAARPHDDPFVAVHVGALDPRRRWPLTHFIELVSLLERDGLSVVLVGSQLDRHLSHSVAQARPHCSDLSGQLSLGGTLGLLSRAAAFAGNDSGPRHLAVAAGTPTVGIFWAPNVLTFGPLTGPHHAAIAFRNVCPLCRKPQSTQQCQHPVSLVAEIDPVSVHCLLRAALEERR